MSDSAPKTKMPRASWLTRYQHKHLPLEGVLGRRIEEREERREDRWKERMGAMKFMIGMGFPEDRASRLIANLTPYHPWLQERWNGLRWSFSRTGRLCKTIQRLAREDVLIARQSSREERRRRSEREQSEHIGSYWQEARHIADMDIIDGLKPLYPLETDEELLDHIEGWGLRSRLKEHYGQRQRLRALQKGASR